MSNLLIERPLDVPSEPEQTSYLQDSVRNPRLLQLCEKITFARIFAGDVQIDEDSIIFDRTGSRLDTSELLNQLEAA